MGAVQRRPDQRIHTGGDAHVAHSPLLFNCVTTATSTPALATKNRPGSIQNSMCGNRCFSRATPRIQRAEIDSAVAQLLGHADSAAQIDDRRRRENAAPAPRAARPSRSSWRR